MKLLAIIRKRRTVLIVVGLIGLLGYLYFSPTPHFGKNIPLGFEIPLRGSAQAFGSESISLAPSKCEAILESLKTASGGGPVHACPPFGTIVLEYANGDTKSLTIMPAHRFGRIDLVFEGYCYSMSAHTLFRTLEKAGLRRKIK
jgi:hypothetical protein